MADYIRTNILCQSYVHAEVHVDFARAVEAIRDTAVPLITKRAKFFLYEDAHISFDSESGSVKSRITIFGTLILALQGITNYKDFREGISLLYSDVHRVAEMATTETLFALKVRGQQVKRTEHRVGIVGSLHRIICAIDAAKSDSLDKGILTRSKELESIREDVLKLIDNMNNAEDVTLVTDELHSMCGDIPEHPTPGRRDPRGLDSIPLYQDQRRKLISSIAKAKTARLRALANDAARK